MVAALLRDAALDPSLFFHVRWLVSVAWIALVVAYALSAVEWARLSENWARGGSLGGSVKG
jgi:hypothetical protein